ncbi:MAG: hypothetical protein HZB91_07770 [Elusimicrobia bacterium]|nr:hypothetical protein [Elusimicrobiota bacterium]
MFPAAWLPALAVLLSVAGQGLQLVEAATGHWFESVAPWLGPSPKLSYGNYQRSVIRAAPPASAARPASVAVPTLVETGSFRVDFSALLDKLRAHQLLDPADFILCWIRCAVLSKAGRLDLSRVPGGIRILFDGEPLSNREIDEPYAALLDRESPQTRKGRHFAYGLLAAQRMSPSRIEVASGAGPARARMVLNRKGESSGYEGDPGSETRTMVLVGWGGWFRGFRSRKVLRRAAEAFGMTGVETTIDGRRAEPCPWKSPAWNRRGEWTLIDRDGWKGALCAVAAPREDQRNATVHLYLSGTRIQTVVRAHVPAYVAFVSCDDLRLDLSQSRIVEGDRLEEGLEMLSQASRRA